MGQNTSSAVMQQRHVAPDALDDFPTPPWATRALCEWIRATCAIPPLSLAREPAANRGHMARVLGEYFGEVAGSDCHDYGAGFPVKDYLVGEESRDIAWTITNPPFKLAGPFIERALGRSQNTAMLVRSAFLEGAGRYRGLFKDRPPSDVLIFCERVVMWQGMLLDPDLPVRSWNKRKEVWEAKKPTTATSYIWAIWREGRDGQSRNHWIPPGTRARLTRPGDYPELPENLRPVPAGGVVEGDAGLFGAQP
jgi:hypothetical protein